MRFKCIRQLDSKQCGLACLSMIALFYGKKLSIRYLENLCHIGKDGISLLGISECAKKIGLKPTVMAMDLSGLKHAKFPCILHWNNNHFVVLHKYNQKTNYFYIADPGQGLRKYSESEFKTHWTGHAQMEEGIGIAMFLDINHDFYNNSFQESTKYHSLSFLSQYIRPYGKYYALIFLFLLLGCFLQLIIPFLTQWIVDKGIKHKDINLIWLILLGELAIVLGRTMTDFLRRWLLMHVSIRINLSLVSDFFIKLLRLPMSYFDSKLLGDLMQRINDHNRVQTFLSSQLLGLLFTSLSLIAFGIVLFFYDFLIFCIFLAGCTLYGLWVARFLTKRKIIDYELFEVQAKNQNLTYDFLTSMQEIKLQNCERRRRWEWEDNQAELFKMQMKSLQLQQTQEAGSIFINEVKNILITIVSATAVIQGQMSLGAMLAVQYIIGQLNSPVEQLMMFIYSIQDVKISLERINEIHQGKDEDNKERKLKEFCNEKSISLNNVDFSYDPHSSRKTLEDISFTIPTGKITAIVGTSGSGKTTLIKLMLGYYKIMDGCIDIAGNNLNEYDLKWWRQNCGVVMQDGVIFSESIARNIAVDDQEIDFERLERAAEISNIHEYVMTLPLKYNTIIGRDGINLSQGQKQRILIARAVYKNPDFIFFDEATNSLDAKNEKEIVGKLNEFYRGRTVVIVAHRLSTVKDANQIIVIDKGKIVESGSHSYLISRNATTIIS